MQCSRLPQASKLCIKMCHMIRFQACKLYLSFPLNCDSSFRRVFSIPIRKLVFPIKENYFLGSSSLAQTLCTKITHTRTRMQITHEYANVTIKSHWLLLQFLQCAAILRNISFYWKYKNCKHSRQRECLAGKCGGRSPRFGWSIYHCMHQHDQHKVMRGENE